MIRYRETRRPSVSRVLLSLLVPVCLALAGCDRALLEPALRDGAEAAVLEAGLTGAEVAYSLPGLVLEAARTLDRSGGERARELIAELGRQHAVALAFLPQASSGGDLSSARAALRAAQLEVVVDVLGRPGAERALAGAADGLARAGAFLDGGLVPTSELTELDRQRAEIAALLETARDSLDAGAVLASLDAVTGAADDLQELRRALLDLQRIPALPELYLHAERLLTVANGALPRGAELLAEHEELEAAAREASAGADRERAHAALAEVRDCELRMTLEALGPASATSVLEDVGTVLQQLQADSVTAEPRLRRMLRAAADLHHRARLALHHGDPKAALDLGSYAAGLVNAYRAATSSF